MRDLHESSRSTDLGVADRHGHRRELQGARIATPFLAKSALDATTARAAHAFMRRLEGRYIVLESIVYGSRARQTHSAESDADLAIILEGQRGDRYATAGDMARIAFDILMETGVMIDALPLWADEFARPDLFSNPALIDHIKRDGVRL